MIEIKDISGQVRFFTPINKGAKGKFTLMKEDYIILCFSTPEPIRFCIGDYTDLAGVLDDSLGGRLSKVYEVTDTQSPVPNISTGGYDYQLKMEAYYMKWKNKIFKYIPEGHGQEAGWSLTASLSVHMGIFLRNLKELGYTFRGTDFTFAVDDTVPDKAVALTYSNTNMLDALTMMAEALECEWWVTENVIRFGRCEFGDAVKIELYKEASDMQRSESSGTFATRLYVFGGERNIPVNYRPVNEQVVVNGVVQRRLMLPEGVPYLDAYPGMSQEEAIEEVLIIDDIYPKRIGTISEVTSYNSTVENEDGSMSEATFYRYRDTELEFSKEYIIEGQTLHVIFESGLMNGMDFEVIFNPNGDDPYQWEIIRNEDYGRPLPDDIIKPQDGDKYVLYGYDTSFVSDKLMPEAEQELMQEGQKRLDKMMVDDSTFTVPLYSTWVYEDKVNRTFDVGQRINLINEGFFVDGRVSRVIGWEFNLDIPWDTPTYTIGESAAYSRIGSLEESVGTLTYKGQTFTGSGSSIYVIRTNDSTPASDSNVFSALKSIATFLRKDKTDSTTFLQRFLGGADFGQFTTGMVGGSGARIDQYGDGEMHSLKLRDSLTVPQITFNCIDVISGDKANSFAYGTIKSVDTEQMIAELELLEGQWGTPHVNDFCRGTFHNIIGENATEDKEDANGFWSYSGFSTSYFMPIEILENVAGTYRFRYSLQQGTSVHPIQGMNFFAYGNPTDKTRQSITYETRYYTRRLKDVTTWAINPTKNISMQDGLLDGLVIGGMEMSGYGTYSENNYFTGVQIQFTPEQEENLRGESAYGVVLSEYSGIVTLDENGNVITGFLELSDVYSGESDVYSGESDVVVSNYRLKTRIQAFRGKEELYYSETFGNGKFLVDVETHGCTCVQQDGVVYITGVTDTNYAYVDIVVNCEGNAEFRQTYTLTFVKDGITPVLIDLDNEMGVLTVDSSGNVTGGLPFSTTVRAYSGNDEIAVEGVTLDVPEGVTATSSGNVVTVQSVSVSTTDRIQISVNATYRYKDTLYIKSATLILAKFSGGEDAVIYDLFPSVQCIKIEKDGSLSTAYISCHIKKVAGQNASFLQTLPEGLTMKFSIDGGVETVYEYRSNISCSNIKDSIRFYLYQGEQMLDAETVFVLSDGQDGDPGKPGDDGSPGVSGCSIRVSEWVVGKEYRNDTGLEDVPIRFLDIALVQNNTLDTGWEAYICKKTHISSTTITYRDTTYWEQTSQNVASLFLSFLLAKNAKIKFLQSNELVIYDSDGNPTTVLSGTLEGDKTRLAIGSTDLDNAPFRVNEKGETWQTNAHIKGEVNATSGTFENVTVASIASKNGTFNIDKDGNTSVKDLTATGGTFKEGTFENITLKKSINTPNDKLYIDAEGNVKLKDVSADGGTFNNLELTNAKVGGNIIIHDDGNVIYTVPAYDGNAAISIYGVVFGSNPSALISIAGIYYKLKVFNGYMKKMDAGNLIVSDSDQVVLSIFGVLYNFPTSSDAISGFSEWLNSI